MRKTKQHTSSDHMTQGKVSQDENTQSGQLDASVESTLEEEGAEPVLDDGTGKPGRDSMACSKIPFVLNSRVHLSSQQWIAQVVDHCSEGTRGASRNLGRGRVLKLLILVTNSIATVIASASIFFLTLTSGFLLIQPFTTRKKKKKLIFYSLRDHISGYFLGVFFLEGRGCDFLI